MLRAIPVVTSRYQATIAIVKEHGVAICDDNAFSRIFAFANKATEMDHVPAGKELQAALHPQPLANPRMHKVVANPSGLCSHFGRKVFARSGKEQEYEYRRI
jgi:hypothetical protein